MLRFIAANIILNSKKLREFNHGNLIANKIADTLKNSSNKNVELPANKEPL